MQGAGFCAQAVSVLRVGDGDQPTRALGDRAAPQLGDSVLGHDLVDDVLERGHRGPEAELGHDARHRVVGGGGRRSVVNGRCVFSPRLSRTAAVAFLCCPARDKSGGSELAT